MSITLLIEAESTVCSYDIARDKDHLVRKISDTSLFETTYSVHWFHIRTSHFRKVHLA